MAGSLETKTVISSLDAVRQCAFLTLENPDGFFIYDHLAFEPMRRMGWHVEQIPWSRQEVDWSAFDVVVIRSTWDYQAQPDRFMDLLANIERSGTRLLNSLAICRWNLNKRYLLDLESAGVPIVPTLWLDRLDETALNRLFERLNADRIVVKPVVGANADDTFSLQRDVPEEWQQAVQAFSAKPLMAQPFLHSIITEGEYSMFYFGGAYSHAVLKTPRPNDFRVQEEHGGSVRAIGVEGSFALVGQKAHDAIPGETLYARVDLVRLANGTPALIELELIEPSLYFSCDDQSPARFANALEQLLAGGD